MVKSPWLWWQTALTGNRLWRRMPVVTAVRQPPLKLTYAGLVLSLCVQVVAAQEPPRTANYQSMADLLAVGEYKEVQEQLVDLINELRIEVGNYDLRLATPYLLLGDAQLGMKQPKDALESFETALHIQRTNSGLAAETQVETLYRMSQAMADFGDYTGANTMQERAYGIMLQRFGVHDNRLLPSMLKLIEWYESNRRYSAAKILYLKAIDMARSTMPNDDPRHVKLSRAFALGMRNTVFPPLTGESRFRGFPVRVPGYEPIPEGIPLPSSYSLGQRELLNVIARLEADTEQSLQQIAIAKLHLADWYQLFGKESRSTRLYRELWEDMAPLPNLRSEIFDEPKLLYIRLPQLAEDGLSEPTGLVELLLTISYRGEVTGRVSLRVEPKDSDIEYATRMAAREARFRPAFLDGRPITTKRYRLMHRYPLQSRRG